MFRYIIKRLLYLLPILVGVILLTFLLFNVVTDPVSVAKQMLGPHANENAIKTYIEKKGLDKPLYEQFYNNLVECITLDFGRSDRTHQKVKEMIFDGIGPSLALMIPAFISTVLFSIVISLFCALYRNTFIDRSMLIICIVGMSFSVLAYIIFGQYILGYQLKYIPIAGFEWGLGVVKFLILPGSIFIIAYLGMDVRFYRTVILDEINQDYVKTARAKGLNMNVILFKHILRNSLIPIITQVVGTLPFLFTGSLLLEDFFGIPGLGSLLINAINDSDFNIIKAVTFLTAILYVLANLLGDILYSIVDPRTRVSNKN